MNTKGLLQILLTSLLAASCGSGDELTMLVGTYTDAGSEGIYKYSFNQESGEHTSLGSVPAVNPSYLIKNGKQVYAVSESNSAEAAAYSFDYDRSTAGLKKSATSLTGGEDPCYIATNGRIVVTANYSGGSVSVFTLDKKGALNPEATRFKGNIGGPDSLRQSTPHVHCTVFSPDGKYLFATDFSADKIIRFDVLKDGLSPSTDGQGGQLAFQLEPDCGPRHMIFDRRGRKAYVIGELSGNVSVMRYRRGELSVMQVVDADKADARGSADIHLSPDGKFLYASNRLKDDGIAVFKVKGNGRLQYAGYTMTGIHPRNFAITPNGKYLLCACRDSDCIEIYERDSRKGTLSDTGRRIALSHPVCICFDE